MSFLDWFFPRHCLGCGQEGHYFCPVCREKIQPLAVQICPVCQKPAIYGQTHPYCQSQDSLNGLISCFLYKGMIKKAIGKLKYHFLTDLAEELVELMVLFCPLPRFEKQTLVPVPLHLRRERWRGFNQSELLGKKLANHFGWQVKTDILSRQRYTQPQMSLKGQERKVNIIKAFKVNSHLPDSIFKSQLILFDDVWTTGSTLKEVGKVLKMAGFKNIWGLTICR
jgi:ComF family protein